MIKFERFFKDNKVLLFLTGFFLLLVLSIGVLSVILLISGFTYINWPEVINILFNFTLEFISLTIAFMLGQVFWENKNKRQRRTHLLRVANSYLFRIKNISIETIEFLTPNNSGTGEFNVDENRNNAKRNISQLISLGNIFFDLFGTIEFENIEMLTKEFIEKIKPELDLIESFVNQGQILEIQRHLNNLISVCDRVIQLLIEEESK